MLVRVSVHPSVSLRRERNRTVVARHEATKSRTARATVCPDARCESVGCTSPREGGATRRWLDLDALSEVGISSFTRKTLRVALGPS